MFMKNAHDFEISNPMKINDFHIQLLSKRYTCKRHIPRVGVEVNINVKSYLVYKFKSHFHSKITIAVAMAQLYCRASAQESSPTEQKNMTLKQLFNRRALAGTRFAVLAECSNHHPIQGNRHWLLQSFWGHFDPPL